MSRMRLLATLAAAVATAPLPLALAAQSPSHGPGPEAARRAAVTITGQGIRDRLAVIADDSMLGRATPSPQLEEVAAWVASQFRLAGLAPGGDSGSFIQRYAIRRLAIDTASFIAVAAPGLETRWRLGRDAALVFGDPPAEPLSGPVVFVSGVPTDSAKPFGDVPLKDAIVVQLAHVTQFNSSLLPLITRAVQGGARAWIGIADAPSTMFDALASSSLAPQYDLPGMPVMLPISIYLVRDSSALAVLRAAGRDPAALLAPAAAPTVAALAGVTATIGVRRTVVSQASAPNVIGVLPGSDPRLRNEYVFFTAHMDHIGVPSSGEGCASAGGDSICNGADDDGSGTTGVVELARAFGRLQPHPRRTLVFMTVSGEERGLWGSGWYTSHPEVPLAATVADLNMDMIGRNPADSVLAIGKPYSSLGALVDSVAAAHPALHMRAIDDTMPQERLFFRSDHFNFARHGVPILFFTTGLHRDYHRPSDSVEKIDADQEARVLQLVFYLGLDVADATARPAWTPEGRQAVGSAVP